MKARPRPKTDSPALKHLQETALLAGIAEDISSSLVLDDVLGRVYKSFRGLLPYDRIGLSLIDEDKKAVRAIGVRSNAKKIHLGTGYSALMKGSSLEKLLETGKPRILNDLPRYLKEHPRSDATRRIVAEGMRSSLTYPLIAQGKPVGFIFFSNKKTGAYSQEDIDSFRRVATLLSLAVDKGRLYKELEEADAMKRRILGIASHDLCNPLTVVIGYLALMQESSCNEECKEHVGIIQRKCKQMLSIIDSLLDSSIVQTGELELNLHALDMREFLREVGTDSRLLAEQKSIRLKLDLPPWLPVVSADRMRLLQVFDNLISNAVKYSLPKTEIKLSARVTDRAVEILVSDQGQGIPQEEFSLLFKEFGRASVATTAGERSIGLGLSIAQRIAKAHGGNIRVDSQPGAGTTFTVSLPLQGLVRGRVRFDPRG